ncbi:PAS domain S-box protein [Azonexus sp. IMCC34839]|uniref:PAS domain S-box protein n=1 Tax=Azonexus sp. IMCC34839 TaxID=3133695 RepID=UPI00399A1A7C
MPRLRLRGLVIGGIVLSNLIVFTFTGYSLLTSYRNHEQRAEVLTQNIARALELNLANSTEKIDLLLRSTADELQRQLGTAQGIDETGMQFFLARLQDRIPDLEGLRVADASGLVFLGKDVRKEDKVSWADREYFIHHRDHDDRTLQISKPRLGRVAKKHIVGFALRYNHPDGRFAGVISATLPLDYYSQLLSRFDVGPHGTISLRDSDLGLITRVPAISDKPAGQIGNKILSPEFMQLFGSGIASATFKTPASGDGFQRIITYHNLGYVPMIAIVGTADKDYLEHWYDELYLSLTVVLGFLGLSFILGRLTLFFLRRTEQESERNRLYLQQASDGIHILDSDGRLIEASDSFFNMLGYTREELIGASVAQWDARWPTDTLLHDILPAKLALTSPASQETAHRRKDGRLIDIELNLDAFDIDGKRYLYAAARDITERKQAEAALRESEQHFRTLANGGTALIWTAGIDKLRDYFNEPWLRFTGHSLTEELGNGWLDGVHPDDRDRFASIYAEHFEQRSGFSMEYRLRNANSQYRWIRDDGKPRYDTQGNFIGYIGFCYDITEQKTTAEELERHRHDLEQLVIQRTEQLAAAKASAEAASVAKSAFLANMSHEIRTPLNAITGMAHLIRRTGLSDEQANRFDKLEAASQHLLEIINTVLDLSKIEAGKFTLDESEIRVEGLLANVTSMLHERAQLKGLQFITETRAIPHHLCGDATRLQQALLNYASNAVKFTESGRITLRVLTVEEDRQQALLRFEVQDTGIGIEASVLDKLFDAFEQADNSTTRRYGGTGLGLAITRKLAELMGGTAGASSTPGKGSLFWFTARLRKSAPATASANTVAAESAEERIIRCHAGKRVLLVEDEPVNREITLSLLEDAKLSIDCAEDGIEALDLIAQHTYDLILMDMQMPRMDGLETTRQIRQRLENQCLPIVAMTANAFAEDKAQCFAAGMDDFLAKPARPDTLFETVLAWLEQPHRNRPPQ